MDRRALLALLGASTTAGCAALGSTPTASPSESPSPEETPKTTDDETPEPTDDGTDRPHPKNWSLVEYEGTSLTVSLVDTSARLADEARLTMAFDSTATADHPAVLRGTFTNENEFANTFRLDELPLFGSVPSAWPGGRPRDDEYTYRDALVLAPTENHEAATKVPDWERADSGRWKLAGDVDGPWLPGTKRLDAGESFAFEYALVGRAEGEGFPAARYEFRGYDDPELVVAAWPTDQPGPTGESRFAGASPPSLPVDGSMAWFHDADAGSQVYLEPSTERLDAPAKAAFTLVNHSHERAAGNPYFWRLWKHVDGDWFHVAPWGWPVPMAFVPPGGTEEWTLAAFHGHTVPCEGALPVGFLGGGRYAFEVGISRDKRTHAALLDVNAPATSVAPMDGLNVTDDGDTVRVEWPRREGEVPRATLTLTEAADADARLIPEQVMQSRNAALRNTLPYLDDGVSKVTLVTDRNTVSRGARTGGYEDGSVRFRLGGQAYEAAAEFGKR